jgi:2Fe-2S ferredoxin
MVFLTSASDVSAPFQEGDTVLEVAQARRIGLASSCGGMGSCGTCRVLIESDPRTLPARTEIEKEMALDRGFLTCERLACQLIAFPGLCVRVPETDDE